MFTMQPNFTLNKTGYSFNFAFFFFTILFFGANQLQAQSVIYETTHISNTGAEITATANGPTTSMGDAIVLAGTNRYVTQVQVAIFTLAGTTPFSLSMAMYTDCSTSGATGACGSGPGVLIPGSTITITGVTPPATGQLFLATFNYTTPVDLNAEADNQINLVINASRSDVFWVLGETPVIGSLPPGEPATSFVTRCGSTAGNNGCSRDFGLNNNFDIKITAQATAAVCTGTPNPGATNSSDINICANTNFTLSLANPTPGTGVTYQWQSATALAGPYTNIAGANNSTLTTSLTATTYYRAMVTCSGNTGISTPVQVTKKPDAECYCVAGASDTNPIFEKISQVQFNTINNSSTSAAGYENFLDKSTTVIKGQTLPITVSLSNGYGNDQVLVWIDFNKNGSFSDAGELVYTSANGAGPHTGNITIAATADTGPTRMRIRMHDVAFGPNATPCGISGYGQVEDYTVDIQPCQQGTITVQPANKTTTCSGNTTFSITATGSALNYAWQYRVNATSPWQSVTNGGVYSNATTATLTLTNVPSTLNGYQYRALISGPCTAVDFSNPATLTVTPIVPVVTPASPTICVGTIQQLSLTNTVSAATTTTFNASAGLPLAIPDADVAGVTSTATVSGIPAGSVIKNVSIQFNMPHSWVGDIVINLKSPNNQVLNLVGALDNGTGSNGSDDFVNTIVDSLSTTPMSGAPAPRTGTFRADRFTATVPTVAPTTTNNWAPLLSTMNGSWSLAICDLAGGDTGSLTSWSISITYVAPSFAQGVWVSSAPATMFSNAAATIPYVAGTPATSIYVKPTVSTNYKVAFSTPTCNSDTTVVTVKVVNPVTNVVNPSDTSVCIGGNTLFKVSAAGGPVTYQWQLSTDGGTTWTNISGATAATLNLTAVTQAMNKNRYRVILTAAPCVGSITTPAAILTVNALPIVSISAPDVSLVPGETTTITATSTPAAAANGWTWTLNGAALAGTSNTQNVTADGIGTYQATVRDVNGCTATSNNLVIGGEASDRLFIYPNPTSGIVQVRLYYNNSDVDDRRVVSVYNQAGQLVDRKEYALVNSTSPYLKMEFDLKGRPAGTYVIRVAHKYTHHIVSGLLIKVE